MEKKPETARRSEISNSLIEVVSERLALSAEVLESISD